MQFLKEENVMKAYLDMQIWYYMTSDGGQDIKKLFEQKMKEDEWEYYLSVAHLEELFHNEKTDKDDSKIHLKQTEILMRNMANSQVISPTFEGLVLDDYDAAKRRVHSVDTQDLVKAVAGEGFKAMKNNMVDPAVLFRDIPDAQGELYKKVWETNLMKGLLAQSGLDEARGTYEAIKHDYMRLQYIMAVLFELLSAAGYRRDKGINKYVSGKYDTQHAICATFCDVFVTADEKFADRYKAVAYYLDIPLKILNYSYKDNRV
jgi:hypothetical protein